MSALGHQFQDTFEKNGIDNVKARELAHAVAELVRDHFIPIAADFEKNGHKHCATALRLECNTLFTD